MIPLEQAMSTAVSSIVPAADGSGGVIVDEPAHASTRSVAMQDRTLNAIETAMKTASTDSERAFLQGALLKFQASLRLRQIAADPALLQAQEKAAALGNVPAAATVQGIAVMRLADLKDDARSVATGTAQGNPEAFAQAREIAAAAADPSHPAYPTAVALQSLITQIQNPAALVTAPLTTPAIATATTSSTPLPVYVRAPTAPTPAPSTPPLVAPAPPTVLATPPASAAPIPAAPVAIATSPAPPTGDACGLDAYAAFQARMARDEIEACAAAKLAHGTPLPDVSQAS